MFDGLEKWVPSLRNYPECNPSTFDDPLALQTSWRPLKNGGASFRTHHLERISSSRVEFQASLGAKMFCLLFVVVGVGLFIAGLPAALSQGISDQLLMPFVGLVCAVAGSCIGYSILAPSFFDRQENLFQIGWKKLDELVGKETLCVELSEIYALQIIWEWCRGGRNSQSYYSYELNLVLNNGERVNVIDHGDLNTLRQSAKQISQFLDKPVWDATLE